MSRAVVRLIVFVVVLAGLYGINAYLESPRALAPEFFRYDGAAAICEEISNRMTRSSLDYADALQRVAAVQAQETDAIHPLARSTLLTHGKRTERAIVFLHGLTNSPGQFRDLGTRLFEQGYNVWTPRLPRHGYADRMTRAHADLTAQELAAATNDALDIARGLGERVTVAGLSLGGTLAAYAAQCRADVELAVMINPGFAMAGLPYGLGVWLARQTLLLPNPLIWWNPLEREKFGPAYSYPGFYPRASAQVFLLGANVYARSFAEKPGVRAILSVTSRDPGLNHGITARVVENWRARGACVREYQFGGDNVPILHDIIDPWQPDGRPELFYPVLVELIRDGCSMSLVR